MHEPMKSGTARTKLCAGTMATLALLMSGCGSVVASATETETALCRELRANLPTWSVRDTAVSKTEGARFLEVFDAVCPE